MQKKITLISILLLTIGQSTIAQDDWLSFPGNHKDSTTHKNLNFSGEQGKLTVHEDSRLKKLSDFVRQGEESITGVQIPGYRIVIFFDQDKSVVSQQKANFLSRYNEHKAYVDYMAPNYRVRVGNFRTQLEAEALKAEILSVFPTAVVVEDYIELPELPSENINETE
ncbi:SPOR domain-containing protein [Crocinitomix algicola]|uniref:SPOR domain-containing protein n=1 Tax=Crocinitomix algicola TaxID=1740263 RepID=UPI00082FC7DE|nr:SPOR domain-containing protein [Crocinitomix algicola]